MERCNVLETAGEHAVREETNTSPFLLPGCWKQLGNAFRPETSYRVKREVAIRRAEESTAPASVKMGPTCRSLQRRI